MLYTSLRNHSLENRQRIVSGLRKLRTGLRNHVPRKGPGSLLLATWNIREFGGTKYGGRSKDAEFFIAECLNHFDLIAVQEVRRDLQALDRVMKLLGPQWDAIFTDVSYSQGGNSERLAFLYDKNQCFFTGLAGELVLPPKTSKNLAQIARTPFVCGFQAGWSKFNLCTVHIYYGKGDQNPRRVSEIKSIAKLLGAKAKDYIRVERQISYSPENLLLLGDFNIAKHSHATYDALTKEGGFVIPKELQELPGSNVAKDKFYDQIAFYGKIEGIKPAQAGIFDFFEYVYNDEAAYTASMKETKAKSFKDWRTYQMSDHLIMWAQFEVDRTDVYLNEVLNDRDSERDQRSDADVKRAKKSKRSAPAKKRITKKRAAEKRSS
jgi:hypothetical protein